MTSQTRFWLTPFNSFCTVIKKKIKRRKFTGFIIIVEWLKKFVVVLNRLDSYCFMSLSYFYSSRDNLPIIGSLIVNSRPLRKSYWFEKLFDQFQMKFNAAASSTIVVNLRRISTTNGLSTGFGSPPMMDSRLFSISFQELLKSFKSFEMNGRCDKTNLT